jgi:hypothetical protein
VGSKFRKASAPSTGWAPAAIRISTVKIVPTSTDVETGTRLMETAPSPNGMATGSPRVTNKGAAVCSEPGGNASTAPTQSNPKKIAVPRMPVRRLITIFIVGVLLRACLENGFEFTGTG